MKQIIKTTKLSVIMALSIIVVTIFAALVCSCSTSENAGGSIFTPKNTIDVQNYITIDYGKYNGYASPDIDIDYEALSNQIDLETFRNYTTTLSDEIKYEIASYNCQAEVFDIEFAEGYDNLSNGDKIVVKISIQPALESEGLTLNKLCDGLDIKFHSTEIEYTVSGLEEPKNVIDIFEGIEQYITYSGANGNGYIRGVNIPNDYSIQIDDIYFVKGNYTNSVKIINGNTKIGEFSYQISGNKLSEGDTLKLTAEYPPIDTLEELGYIVPTTKTNITVPDLGEYLTSKEQLTPEIIEIIKAKIYEEHDIESIVKIYYATYKPGIECTYDSTSFIIAIVYEESWSHGYYCLDELRDIVIKPNGSIVVENYHDSSRSVKSLEKAEGALDTTKYDFVELG